MQDGAERRIRWFIMTLPSYWIALRLNHHIVTNLELWALTEHELAFVSFQMHFDWKLYFMAGEA